MYILYYSSNRYYKGLYPFVYKRWLECERCRRIKRDRAKKMYVPTKKLI